MAEETKRIMVRLPSRSSHKTASSAARWLGCCGTTRCSGTKRRDATRTKKAVEIALSV